jgi:hypothetical protein
MDQAGSGGQWLASDGRWYPSTSATPARRTVGSRDLITAGLVAAIVAGLVGLFVISRTPTATATAPVTPPVLVTSPGRVLFLRAVHDADLQGWVHVGVSATVGTTATTASGDAGSTSGQQTIHVGTQSASVVYLDHVAYVQFSSLAIAQTLGAPTMSAAAIGKWVSFLPTTRGYGTIIAGVTLPSLVSQLLQFPGALTIGTPTVVNGQPVLPIAGETRFDGRTIKATLDVTHTAHPLPVEVNAASPGASQTVIFSNWDTPVTITAPSGATPAAALLG